VRQSDWPFQGDWFGVDYARLDDDGELIEPTMDHEFHFCSADHAIAFLMERSYLPETPSNIEGA